MKNRVHIAVFLPNWVGDVVMATPAVRALRHQFPDAHLTGLLRPYVAGVPEGTHWPDSHLFLDTKGPASQHWPAVGAQLRQESIEWAVLFPNSFHSAFVAWLGRCRRRVGYARYARRCLLTDPLKPRTAPNGSLLVSPVIEAYNRLAEYVGCPAPSFQMELATTEHDERAADVVWEQARLTV